jgi:hypothetical protein
MRTHSYLGEAVMGTEVVRVSEVEIPEAEFAVPEGYKQTPLLAVLEAQNALTPEEKAAVEKRKPLPTARGAKDAKKNAPKK